MAISAFASNDRDLADRVLRNKEELGIMERELVQAHLDRLRKGFRESIDTSHIHLDIIGNLARINSLITHIIYPIAEEKRARGREDVGIDWLYVESTNDEGGFGYGSGMQGSEVTRPVTLAPQSIFRRFHDQTAEGEDEFEDGTHRYHAGGAAARAESGIRSGVCYLYVPHTTSAITINENSDPNVGRDILKELNKVIPFEDDYGHTEGNSAAHIKSSIMACPKRVMVEEGRLALGTWQAVFFLRVRRPP